MMKFGTHNMFVTNHTGRYAREHYLNENSNGCERVIKTVQLNK